MSQARAFELATSVISTTLNGIEPPGEIPGSARTLWKLQTALEKAGVEFIPADEQKGPGVRLKERDGTKAEAQAEKGGLVARTIAHPR